MGMDMYKALIISTLVLLIASASAAGTEIDPNSLFSMSLEDLMAITVVSASRSEQSLSQATVPISVISAEDIHYSGLTSIPEILNFTPGMDILRLNRNYYAVGVRGLHDIVSDRTLTLVNGRSADSPVFGGSEFFRLPILMEDIERIEVVRGPGGATWGANAFTGVINVITRKPEDLDGWFVSSTVNEFGDSYSHLRYSFSDGPWDWKLSAGYEDHETSEAASGGRYTSYSGSAIVDTIAGYNNFVANDWARNFILDTEAVNQMDDDNAFRFGVAYSHMNLGDFEYIGNYPMEDNWHETVRSFTKLEHQYDSGDTAYLQWAGNFSSSNTVAQKWKSSENDLELQYDMASDEDHHMSIGGNFRHFHISPEATNDLQVQFEDDVYDEYFAGLFLIDQIKMNEKWTLEGQFRTDWYSGTDLDWSVRVSSLHSLGSETDRNLRLSVAKSFRTPFTALREITTAQIPLDLIGLPGLSLYNVQQAEGLDNEETWAIEAGYSEKLSDRVFFQTNVYYQQMDDLIGCRTLEDPLGLGRQFLRYDNLDGADTYGVEVELKTQHDFGTISSWYSYNHLQRESSDQDLRGFEPAQHKAGLTCRVNLNNNWTANANYRYTDSTLPNPAYGKIAINHRLDLTLARKIAAGKGELMIGITDVLNKTNDPVPAMNQLSAHETPGRTVFARLQMYF